MEAAASQNAAIQAKYSKDKKVGEGTYAVVYLGKEIVTGRKIAIKKIKVGQFKDGLDMSAIREVKFLRELYHPNVISLLDVFSSKNNNLNLVLPFLPLDLELLIKSPSIVFQTADIKSYLLMTLRGLEYCHRNYVLHRDLKPNNLLISEGGVLKIADFGLAREYAEDEKSAKMTTQVVTRWYRPPELLFGARAYSTGVDLWSVGCIFAELMLRVPFMAGETDVEQLEKIFQALGTPTEADWPGHSKLPEFVPLQAHPKTPLQHYFVAASPSALTLLSSLLAYDPRKRISARRSVTHDFFLSQPTPTHPSKLPLPPSNPAAADVQEGDGRKEKREKKRKLLEGLEEQVSSLLSHKSIRVKKPTHGHHETKTGEVRPVDSLVDRNQQLKHITKSLLHYYKGLANIESHTAKETLALTSTIQVPFHEGHQFMGEGGWQEVLYEVRDQTKILSEHHAALATTLDKTVVQQLEGVRSDIKAHITAIEKEAGALADEVAKERATSASHLTTLSGGIETFENSAEQMLPQHDPYITHSQVKTQLTKQVLKENDLQASLIRFQQQQPTFEAGVFTSLRSAATLYEEAKELKVKDIAAVQKKIQEALQSVAPDAEYNYHASKPGAVIDPNSPLRSVDAITFPGFNHPASVPIKEGILERKKRFTKSYKEAYYVLSASGYLHERKSNDDVNDIKPGFSLFLPECSLGAPAKESDKSHKFHVEGNKAIKSSFEGKMKSSLRFGGKEIAYAFRARTHTEMLAWWGEMDKLSRDTKAPVTSTPRIKADPIASAVANVGYAAPAEAPVIPVTEEEVVEDEEEEEEEEEDDEEGGSSAEEEEEAIARTAPSTPAAGLLQPEANPLEGGSEEAQKEAKGEAEEEKAEVLPTYTGGDGTSEAEKAAATTEKKGIFGSIFGGSPTPVNPTNPNPAPVASTSA